jgi:hypothetical protein
MIAGKLYYDRSVEFARDMLNLSKSREASIKYVKAVRSWARKMKRTEMLAWIKAVWPR